jgi:hypothetical protein
MGAALAPSREVVMSKSTLSIIVPGPGPIPTRTVEVPCRLPEAFTFTAFLGGKTLPVTAFLTRLDDPRAAAVNEVDGPGLVEEIEAIADGVLSNAKAALGIGVGAEYLAAANGVLTAIATAYEAEVAAYDAAVKAHAALPRRLHSLALLPAHPSESALSRSVLMLAKYVEYIFEEACAAQTERAEAQAKVTPIRTVTP